MPPNRRQKYGAVRTEYNGVTYDSKAEATRAAELDLLLRAGEVTAWYPKPKPLTLVDGPKRRDRVTWQADFEVHAKSGAAWMEDVKGVITREFRLKMKLLREKYPQLVVKVIQNGVEVKV